MMKKINSSLLLTGSLVGMMYIASAPAASDCKKIIADMDSGKTPIVECYKNYKVGKDGNTVFDKIGPVPVDYSAANSNLFTSDAYVTMVSQGSCLVDVPLTDDNIQFYKSLYTSATEKLPCHEVQKRLDTVIQSLEEMVKLLQADPVKIDLKDSDYKPAGEIGDELNTVLASDAEGANALASIMDQLTPQDWQKVSKMTAKELETALASPQALVAALDSKKV